MADATPKEFGNPDNRHWPAAQSWLEWGKSLEAGAELERLTPDLRGHPDVLENRLHLYFDAKRLDACVAIATAIIKLAPKRHIAWLLRSHALHLLNRTPEAYDQLLPVGKKFRKVWLIPFSLACYCARMGRQEECELWFKQAMAINEPMAKCMAIHDPDLKPFWDRWGGTTWKRAK